VAAVPRRAAEARRAEGRRGARQRFATAKFQASDKEIEVVNAAIHLRRPILVTGKPGTGKTTLAYAIAHELKLGTVLNWSITSRSTLQESLYRYDAIARLQEVNRLEQRGVTKDPDIGQFIRLGPVGTAMLPTVYPRVLLVDEIDKSDIDLPNDLLHVFEEGRYEIPELTRISAEQPEVDVLPADSDAKVTITEGRVACQVFPATGSGSSRVRSCGGACVSTSLSTMTPSSRASSIRTSRMARACRRRIAMR